jgi:signal transduction histidine kinase
VLALALAYFLAGRLGLLLAIPPGYATAVWPASGIALVGLLILGARAWPGVLLGSFAVNTSSRLLGGHAYDPVLTWVLPAVIATGATVQALLGAHLVRRKVGFPTRLDREIDIGKFLFLAGPASCLVGATGGALSLLATGVITWQALPFSWWTWWVGDSIGVVVLAPLLLAWLTGADDVWRGRRLWLTVPLGVTFALVVLLFVRASAWQNQRLQQGFRERAEAMARDLDEDVQRYVQTLHSVADLRDATGTLERTRFHAFAAGPIARHQALRWMSWNALVPAEERAAFEAARRAEGMSGYQIRELAADGSVRPAGVRPSYVPVTYAEPDDRHPGVAGFDVASDPGRREALERARTSGRVAATARVRLLDEPGGGVSFYLPVVRAGRLEGYVAGVLDVPAMAEHVLGDARRDQVAVTLVDEDTGDTLFASRAHARATDVRWVTRLAVGGHTWSVRWVATPEFLVAHRGWEAWYVLAGGLLFTGLLGGFLLVLTGRSARLESLVAERLAESESRFRELLEAAPDAMIVVQQDGRIGLVNAQAESMFGYAREELIGDSVAKLVPEMRAGAELRGVRKDGSELPIEIGLNPIQTPEGPIGIASIRDISDRLRLEEMRRQHGELEEQNRQIREANRLKSEFLANMSHELRTPLNGIIGFAELMHDGKVGPLAEPHKEYLGDILASAYHLLQLITDVLDLAKIEAGKLELRLEQVDLPALTREVTEVLRGVAAKNRVVIRTHIDGGLRDVRTDPSKVKQILYNYLSNAIKFTDRGGRIEVSVEKDASDRFRLAVEDTGIGVRAEDVGKLFSEFQQLDVGKAKRYGGTGLGLALTKRFAEALGGEVGVRTQVGKGSVFYVLLPIQSQEIQHGR